MLKMILAMYFAVMDNGGLPDGRLEGSLRSTMEASAGKVSAQSNVHFDAWKERWVYTYTIQNYGKLPYIVNWSVADKATELGTPCYHFELKGGQSATIRVEHTDPPIATSGIIACHCRKAPRGMDEFLKHRHIEVIGAQPAFVFGMQAGAPGYLPRTIAERFKREQ